MDRETALRILRHCEPALRARGILRAAVFGSVARGENRPGSDLDIMIEIDPEAPLGVYDYVGLKEYVASLFDGPVDVVSRDALSPKAWTRPPSLTTCARSMR
jgi:predicted nucleotidyltransferase